MTVTSTFMAKVKPGRLEDALGLFRSAAKPIERHGAQNVRVFRGAFSAESYGDLLMTMEYPNGEAWGAAYDATMADDELVSLMARSDSDSSPFLTQGLTSAEEIPIAGPKKPGRVMEAVISRPVPGRFQEAIELASKVATLEERLGASSVRLFWVGAAGSIASSLVLATEAPDMKTMGRISDGFLGGTEGQELLEGVFGSNPVVNMISQELYTEIVL